MHVRAQDSRGVLEPEGLLRRLGQDAGDALGDDLRGLYVHGSWVSGDFHAQRSDVDLLAVLAADPTECTAELLKAVHQQLVADHPDWADRVEVDYISATALSRFRAEPHLMARVSPGEPLHLVQATGHYLLNWHAAREHGRVVVGPRPQDLVPEFTVAERSAVVREHVRQWPDWVRGMHGPGGQAYAVLTLCRALFSIQQGGQVSKRAAASYAEAALPRWADLISWAADWWYAAGSDAELSRLPDVTQFVDEVASRIADTPAPTRAVR